MDKITYLKRKLLRTASEVKFQREEFCYSCVRLKCNCLCPLILPFETNIFFVFLMHPMEAKKEKMGTGKLTSLSLINSRIITGVDFSDDEDVNSIISDTNNYCTILYPGKNSLDVSKHDIGPVRQKISDGKRLVVFLIDGTWPCAKKMMRLSTNLRLLPRLSFTATHMSIFEIKEQPADYCLSTLESVQFFIKECNRLGIEHTDNQEDQMINVFKAMIEFQIKCSLDPNLSSYTSGRLGYSKKGERIRPKKWLTRSIVLAD
ncbi:MAG: tRNA-uridine aminocarboxypropyltransferase [Bacteriovorax sp.]|jgi:DTW domain-containing protein YfiP